MNDYAFLDSWFEARDEVDAVLTDNRYTSKKREARIMFIMEKVLNRGANGGPTWQRGRPAFYTKPEMMNDGRSFMRRRWLWSKSAHFMKSH